MFHRFRYMRIIPVAIGMEHCMMNISGRVDEPSKYEISH
jgi:hypothetical protein